MKSSVIFNMIAICVTIFCIFVAIMGSFIFSTKSIGNIDWNGLVRFWAMMIVVANAFFLPFYVYNFITWINRKVSKKFDDSETFIYTRDVPEYNAAIAGMLYDFRIDYEQEFIACVLDLIAQGYINENAGELSLNVSKVNQAYSENKFLKSEVYILDLCWKNVSILKEGVMVDFEEVLREDFNQFGFFKKENIIDKMKKYFLTKYNLNTKKFLIFVDFIGILISLIIVIGLVKFFKVTLCLLIVICALIMIFIRKTKLTKKGEEEKEKITKLKHFLEKETSFGEKENEEKKIWDRYPAFAVALDVNKQISKDIMKKLNIKD